MPPMSRDGWLNDATNFCFRSAQHKAKVDIGGNGRNFISVLMLWTPYSPLCRHTINKLVDDRNSTSSLYIEAFYVFIAYIYVKNVQK